jgi:hypothetical protein
MSINFPVATSNGQVFSSSGRTWIWYNNYQVWKSSSINGYNFTSSNTAPTSPNVGDRWYNSDYGIELIYLLDPNGQAFQWVDMSSGGQTGANGAIGYTGSIGSIGFTGSTGTNGSNGTNGFVGSSGATLLPNFQSGASSYTLQSSDNGLLVIMSTNGITVPASTFSVGQNITVFNNNASPQIITSGTGVTMYYVSATTGNRTLGGYGLATIVCVNTANVFVISGGVLT